jgi:hypothetical protein
MFGLPQSICDPSGPRMAVGICCQMDRWDGSVPVSVGMSHESSPTASWHKSKLKGRHQVKGSWVTLTTLSLVRVEDMLQLVGWWGIVLAISLWWEARAESPLKSRGFPFSVTCLVSLSFKVLLVLATHQEGGGGRGESGSAVGGLVAGFT